MIADAKATQLSQSHETQVIPCMMFFNLLDTRARGRRVTDEVYYIPDLTVAIPACAAGQEFQNVVVNLNAGSAATAAFKKVLSASECWICPIPRK